MSNEINQRIFIPHEGAVRNDTTRWTVEPFLRNLIN